MRVVFVAVFLLAAVLTKATPVAAATFTVNRIGDAADLNLANAACDTSANAGNQCTLRAAIQEANDTAGPDTINFNITSASKTIAPASQLPQINDAVTINGYSQSGASANTRAVGNNAVLRIVLDGVNASATAIGLRVATNGVTIRGLVIQRWRGSAIRLAGTSNVVAGNFIGTTAAGGAARANGIGMSVTGEDHVIGGAGVGARNLISANVDEGIFLTDAQSVLIANNYIGTNAAGTADLGNGESGIRFLRGSENDVGSGAGGAPNLISGNDRAGVLMEETTDSRLQGNLIGTTASGMAALGNLGDGVQLFNATGNLIGGTTAAARNTLSDNKSGVDLLLSDNNTVQGNRIGTRADGTGSLGNRFGGIIVFGDNNQIGGAGAAGNTVANTINDPGVLVQSDSTGNVIQGNAITGNLKHGMTLHKGPNQVLGNAFIGNGLDGIFMDSSTPAPNGVRISGNIFIGNGGLGIDLSVVTDPANGVTPNDAGDGDNGANLFQNYPVLNTAIRQSNGVTVITGSLNSTANTEFRIEYFLAAVDPTGHGEAQAFIGTQNVTTNGSGNRSFTFAVNGLVVGHQVTATATNVSSGDTSEFAANRAVTQAP